MYVIYCYMSVIYTVISHLQYTSKITIKNSKKHSRGVQNRSSVAYKLVAYRAARHCYETHPWRTICTPRVGLYRWCLTHGVQRYATNDQILYATDRLFPSSNGLVYKT
jgi:hypothetical protein